MAMRRPAEVFPPGDFLRKELEARGWTQTDLAEILGRPVSMVNEIIAGKRGISPETARGLAAAFGTSPELWMNLESAYRLSRVRGDDSDLVARRARLYSKAPVKDMIRRGWIEPSDNIAVLEGRVMRFFQLDSIDDEPRIPRHAAKKSMSYSEPANAAQKAWVLRARQLARAVHTEPFSEIGLADAMARLRLLLHVPQEVRHVPRVLSDAGIKFVIVEHLPGTKIDGACFWVDESPVIAMSLRYDRIDNFWFVLMHEMGHLSAGAESFDMDLEGKRDEAELPEAERQANAFASENLVPPKKLESFIARIRPLYSTRRVEAFAQTLGVHPSIVVGQLHYRGEIAYSSFRKMLAPVREWVTAAALTDGWGAALPATL